MDFIRGCCKKMYIINNEYAILTQQWKICYKYKIFKLKINFAEYTLLIYIIKWNNYIKLQYTHVATFVEDSYGYLIIYWWLHEINKSTLQYYYNIMEDVLSLLYINIKQWNNIEKVSHMSWFVNSPCIFIHLLLQ